MTFSTLSNFHQRLVVSGVAIITILSIISVSHVPYLRPLFVLLVGSIIGGALWEFYHIARNKGVEPLEGMGIAGSLAYVASVFISTQTAQLALLPEVVLGIFFLLIFGYYFVKGKNPLINIAVTILGMVYLAISLSYLIKINYFFPADSTQDGRWWLFYLLLVTKMTDTGGYFFGKNFGSTKLTPYISPKKTWEGAIGGFITAIFISVLFYYCIHGMFPIPPIQISLLQSVILGVLIGILAQFGDLAESLLKRDVGVKDSNHLPGLGGILDIVDSIVFTAPLVYFFLKMQ